MRILAAIGLCFVLAGCAGLQNRIDVATGIYTAATETTVPASVVIPAANAFNILKAGATNYARYCIQQKMAPSICSAGTRRVVVKAVRAGTRARNQMEASVEQNQPALSSVYNLLVAAVNDLKASPAADPIFTGGSR
jgi:uncharacterized lipoprotein YajG